MKPISKKDFYKIIYDGDLDICVRAEYPINEKQACHFKYRDGRVFGKSVTHYDIIDDNGFASVEYFIKEEK